MHDDEIGLDEPANLIDAIYASLAIHSALSLVAMASAMPQSYSRACRKDV